MGHEMAEGARLLGGEANRLVLGSADSVEPVSAPSRFFRGQKYESLSHYPSTEHVQSMVAGLGTGVAALGASGTLQAGGTLPELVICCVKERGFGGQRKAGPLAPHSDRSWLLRAASRLEVGLLMWSLPS